MRRRVVIKVAIWLIAISLYAWGSAHTLDEKAVPAIVAFPAEVQQALVTIDAQINMLIERRDRIVLEAQIKAGLGREYERDYGAMAWRRKPEEKAKP